MYSKTFWLYVPVDCGVFSILNLLNYKLVFLEYLGILSPVERLAPVSSLKAKLPSPKPILSFLSTVHETEGGLLVRSTSAYLNAE